MTTQAQNEEFTRHWTKAAPAVSTFIRSLVPDFHAGEDILQRVAVVLFRKYERYDPSRPFVAWAIGIARNEVLMERRKKARSFIAYQSDIVDACAAVCTEMEATFSETTAALRECMGGIRGNSARVLRLRYEEGLKPQAIAAREGSAPGAIRVMLFRIRKTLEECVRQKLAVGG